MLSNKNAILRFFEHIIINGIGSDEAKTELSSNNLILITAAGTITGEFLPSLAHATDDSVSDAIFIGMRDAFVENNADQSCIFLKNVKLFGTYGNHQVFKYLCVFIDDILAISFGNADCFD